MRAALRPYGLFQRVLGAALSLLLAVQVASGYFPVDLPLEEGSIRVAICGPEGLQTVTISLIDGTVDTSSATGESKCPFCLLGLVDPAVEFSPPARAMAFARVPYVSPVARQVSVLAYDPAVPIRAPPVFL
jgi:hypothetical protein